MAEQVVTIIISFILQCLLTHTLHVMLCALFGFHLCHDTAANTQTLIAPFMHRKFFHSFGWHSAFSSHSAAAAIALVVNSLWTLMPDALSSTVIVAAAAAAWNGNAVGFAIFLSHHPILLLFLNATAHGAFSIQPLHSTYFINIIFFSPCAHTGRCVRRAVCVFTETDEKPKHSFPLG